MYLQLNSIWAPPCACIQKSSQFCECVIIEKLSWEEEAAAARNWQLGSQAVAAQTRALARQKLRSDVALFRLACFAFALSFSVHFSVLNPVQVQHVNVLYYIHVKSWDDGFFKNTPTEKQRRARAPVLLEAPLKKRGPAQTENSPANWASSDLSTLRRTENWQYVRRWAKLLRVCQQ